MNQRGDKGEPSMAEIAALVTTQSTGDVQRALAELLSRSTRRPIVPPPVRRELKRLLEP